MCVERAGVLLYVTTTNHWTQHGWVLCACAIGTQRAAHYKVTGRDGKAWCACVGVKSFRTEQTAA